MSQAGYTPIQLYSSSTASAVPSAGNLNNSALGSELAINITDGKLYYKDNANVVQVIGWKTTPATAGGTGQTTYATGDLLYASGVNTLSKLTAGTNGYVLTLVGGVPAWAASTGGVTSFSAGTTGFTPNTSTTGAITLAGVLNQVNGGTGFSTYTTGDLLYASASNTLSKLAAGTNGYVLTMAGGVPTWAAGGGGGGVTTISFGTTGLTPSTATNGAVTVSGTLAVANGGTGVTTSTGSGSTVLSTSPTLVTPVLGAATATSLTIGTLTYTPANALISSQSSVATYNQIILQNSNTGTTASADFIVNNSLSTDTTYYGDFGMNSSGFTGSGAFNQANTVYLTATTADLAIGTTTANAIHFVTGGSTTDAITIGTSNQIAFNGSYGTAGQVLTSQGSGSAPTWTSAGGGVTGFTSALNTTSPNNTVNVSSLTASGGTTSQGVALVPKGTSAFLSAAIPDGTATGGDTRGQYAVDWQISRSAANQVASGTASYIGGGQQNRMGGSNSGFVAGLANQCYGNYGGSIGGQSILLNADYTVSLSGLGGSLTGLGSTLLNGYYASDRGVRGAVVAGSPYAFGGTTLGVLQTVRYLLGVQTTGSTPTSITVDGAAPSTNNIVILDNNTAYYFKGRVIAGVTSAGNTKAWTVEGVVKRGSSAANTFLVGTVAINVVAADAGASTWAVAVATDTTNGGILINVTGQSATTIRWACEVQTTQVGF